MKSAVCVVLCSAVIVLGCSKPGRDLPATVPAEGVVTLDGKPVPNAAVSFIANSGDYHATAVTDASGKFSLKAFDEKTGAVPGSYKVEVNQTLVSGASEGTENSEGGEAPPVTVSFGLPEKYATITTSGLTYTIPEGGARDIRLELKSKEE
jgi:hypothetical protein